MSMLSNNNTSRPTKLCFICDDADTPVTVYCTKCEDYFCAEDDTAFHKPSSMASHIRQPVSLHGTVNDAHSTVTAVTNTATTTTTVQHDTIDEDDGLFDTADSSAAVSAAAERRKWQPAATFKPAMLPWSEDDDDNNILDATVVKQNNENVNTNNINNNINKQTDKSTDQPKLQQRTDGPYVPPLLQNVVPNHIATDKQSHIDNTDAATQSIAQQVSANTQLSNQQSSVNSLSYTPSIFGKQLNSRTQSKRNRLQPMNQPIATPSNSTPAITEHVVTDDVVEEIDHVESDHDTDTISYNTTQTAAIVTPIPTITQSIVTAPVDQNDGAAVAVAPAVLEHTVVVDDDDDGWESTIAKQTQLHTDTDTNEHDVTVIAVVEQPLPATTLNTLPNISQSNEHFDAQHRRHHDTTTTNNTTTYQTHATVTTQAEQSISNTTTLTPEELTELKSKFQSFSSYQPTDQTIDVYEISKFIHQLEFTYDTSRYIDVIVQSMFHTTVHKRITCEQFINFMYVFYHLHDTVVHTIDLQFVQLTQHDATDECIAVLCPYVAFDSNNELDFTVMKQKLIQAIQYEREETQRQATVQKQAQYNVFNSPTTTAVNQSIDTLPALVQSQKPVDTVQSFNKSVTFADALPDSVLSPSIRKPLPSSLFATQTLSAVQPVEDTETKPAADMEYTDAWTDIEEQYMQHEYDLYIQHIGAKLHIDDMYKALHSLGLQVSIEHIREVYTRVGATHTGCFDLIELKHLYTQLAQLHTQYGVNLQPLYLMCQWYDKNKDGIITDAEFKYIMQQLCNKQLTIYDIEYIMVVADRNNNGQVYIQAILQLIQSHFIAQQQQSTVQQATFNKTQTLSHTLNTTALTNTAVARNTAPEAAYAINVFLRKYIRAQMPSFIEHVLTFACMPTNCRMSILAPYDINNISLHHKYTSLSSVNTFSNKYTTMSSLCRPTLQSNGIQFKELSCDPSNKQLRTTHTSIHSIHEQHLANYITYELIINSVSGIPLPDGYARQAIAARRLRIALYNSVQHKTVSNVYVLNADWHPDTEDVWTFDTAHIHDIHTHAYNQLNHITFKTDMTDIVCVLELTCLVRKPLIHTTKLTNTVDDYIELSCGYTTIPIDIHNPLLHGKHVLRLSGGTLDQPVAIKSNEILARRHGLKALTSYLFNDGQTPSSALTLHLNTQFDMQPMKLQQYVMYIPSQIICTTKHVEAIKVFRQILCDVFCRDTLPLQVRTVQDPFINVFLHIVNQHDVLHCVIELFNQYKKQLDKSTRADIFNGLASDFVKTKFRLAVMHAWPLLSTVLDTTHVTGINDTSRYALLRDCIHSNTQIALACDGMGQIQKSVRPHTYIAAVDKGIEYRNVYRPLHTSELLYNPISVQQYATINMDDE